MSMATFKKIMVSVFRKGRWFFVLPCFILARKQGYEEMQNILTKKERRW